jgi:hypothetical protein
MPENDNRNQNKFATKITKEKKNKKYNLRALRVLRGAITLFLP